jgi:segregation and condensation protein A
MRMVGEWDAVLGHLLFHKSLIGEEDDGRKIDDYMAMVRNLEKGMTVIAADPIEKAISIAFQLVEEQKFNPWDIDLAEFTKLYMRRVRSETDVNFVIAGRLILMAWSILKMQSDEVLRLAEPPAPPEPAEWDPGIYVLPEDIDYREVVLEGEAPLLQEAVRGQQARPVTLMELIDAFDEARQEIQLQETLNRLRETQRLPEENTIHDKVHRENMQEDIAMTWQRITMFNGEPIPFSALHTEDQWDKVAVFSSVLFLAKQRRIRLCQKGMPLGEIFVTNLEAKPRERSGEATVEILPEATEVIIQAPEVAVSTEALALNSPDASVVHHGSNASASPAVTAPSHDSHVPAATASPTVAAHPPAGGQVAGPVPGSAPQMNGFEVSEVG